MDQEKSTPGTTNETGPDLEAQLTEYVAQLPKSTQTMHRWMEILTAISVAVPFALFGWALYLSITWKRVSAGPGASLIPVAWMAFAGGGALPIFLTGLHALLLRAFPPINVDVSKFVTGNKAAWIGGGLMAAIVVVGAFWGFFGYVVWTRNMALIEPMVNILANVVGVGVVIAVVASLWKKFRRAL
jgi:hypothetical protein